MTREFLKTSFLTILACGALYLGTDVLRESSLPGLSQLEDQIWQDWQQLKAADVPELQQISEIRIIGSMQSRLSQVWAHELALGCLEEMGGKYGAEILIVPTELATGPVAQVQIYIYELSTGEFVREVSRLYSI